MVNLRMESGGSGDMFVAATYDLLLSLGLSSEQLLEPLNKLAESFLFQQVSFKEEQRRGVKGLYLNLAYENPIESTHVTPHKVSLILEDLGSRGLISQPALVFAGKIFDILTEAEAEAHGVSIEKVHFHEVGENDSLFDIIGFSMLWNFLIDELGDDKVSSSLIEVGSGSIVVAHGELEVPAPATAAILRNHYLRFTQERKGECLTPTGAAICAFLKPNQDLGDALSEGEVGQGKDGARLVSGMGLGSRNPPEYANFLRIDAVKG